MSQPNKWGWGLIPVAALWAGSNLVLDGRVETDLGTRATAALAGAHAPAVRVDGRDVTLAGTIFAPAEAERLQGAVAGEWGVRRVRGELALPAPARPFDWSLAQDGEAVVLTGAVPDPATRAAILAAVQARFPEAAVQDRTTYASGAPADLAGAVGTALAQTEGLEAPGLSLRDTGLRLSGRAPSAAAREALAAGLAALPQGYSFDLDGIEAPPPYGFGAASDGATLTLTGALPDQGLRDEIAARAPILFAGQQVVDETELNPDAPEGFAQAVRAGLAGLSRLGTGSFRLADAEAELGGEALYAGAADSVRAEFLAGLPAGFDASAEEIGTIAPGPALSFEDCQGAVNELLARTTILFDSGSANIDRVSAGLLDRIVATLGRCPGGAIEIGGHTDATGSDATNTALSQARADAVLAYLTGAGLPAEGLTAAGYGPSAPIASNETEEGRAQNRRIEFTFR